MVTQRKLTDGGGARRAEAPKPFASARGGAARGGIGRGANATPGTPRGRALGQLKGAPLGAMAQIKGKTLPVQPPGGSEAPAKAPVMPIRSAIGKGKTLPVERPGGERLKSRGPALPIRGGKLRGTSRRKAVPKGKTAPRGRALGRPTLPKPPKITGGQG
jgi:hypothetical protein